jgi:hypothetical protein
LRASQHGWTPLYAASFNGHAEVVRALVAKGADVEAKVNVIMAQRRMREHTNMHAATPRLQRTCVLRALAQLYQSHQARSTFAPGSCPYLALRGADLASACAPTLGRGESTWGPCFPRWRAAAAVSCHGGRPALGSPSGNPLDAALLSHFSHPIPHPTPAPPASRHEVKLCSVVVCLSPSLRLWAIPPQPPI